MNLIEVDTSNSSALAKLAYDSSSNNLYVQYRSVDKECNLWTYCYLKVDPSLISKLSSDHESIGKIMAIIRKYYKYKKLHASKFPRSDFSNDWILAISSSEYKHNIAYYNLLLESICEMEPYHVSPYHSPPKIDVQVNAPSNNQLSSKSAKVNKDHNFYGNLADESDVEDNVSPRKIELKSDNEIIESKKTQIRYLIVRIKSEIVECHRNEAIQYSNHPVDWNQSSEHWQKSYNILNSVLLSIDDWYIQLIQYDESNGGIIDNSHDFNELKAIFLNLNILTEHTEMKLNYTLDKLQNEMKKLHEKLRPKLQDRDNAKSRIGFKKWENNPNPKFDFAMRRKDDEESLKLLLTVHQNLSQLQFFKKYD